MTCLNPVAIFTATIVAFIASAVYYAGPLGAVWLGLQAMAIAGSVIHENYPWQLYAIHSGDALMKSVLVSLIVGVWRKRTAVVGR